MKINFNSFGLTLCGGNRTILEVSNRLVERGHDVTITTLGEPQNHQWFSPIKAKIICIYPKWYMKLFRRGFLGKLWDYDYELALARGIPNCDINVATYSLSAFPTLRSGKGVMFYYIQHYELLFFDDAYNQARAQLSYLLPMKKLIVSHWLRDKVKVREEEPIYVGNGVNLDIFYPRRVEHHSENKIILAIFRGMDWKGEKETIEAINLVVEKLPNVEFYAVGNKNYVKGCSLNPKIFETPDDNKLAQLYSMADVFVCASWCEGFGLPPLEAMACGTPVVTTNCLGINEYAINGVNALLVPLKNPKELSEAIFRVLTDEALAETLVDEGLKTAKRYRWNKVVNRVEDAFKNAL
jgi:glycosyltransferase involved in cell wall biosynthesis